MALHVNQFYWNQNTRTLSEEISTLQIEITGTLVVEGYRTTLTFQHIYTDRDADQDVTYWEYQCRDAGITIKIWND